MSESATAHYPFATAAPVPLGATFDGGRLTSDGGPPWLAAASTLLHTPRTWLRRAHLSLLRLATLRLILLKFGGRVYEFAHHVRRFLARAIPASPSDPS